MWASGHGGHHIERAAHGYEPTREEAMAAFAKSWRRKWPPGDRPPDQGGLSNVAAALLLLAFNSKPAERRVLFANF
jgi:hypothetical protein